MVSHPNLVSDSRLVNDAIALLRSFGGRVSCVSVVDFVMKIRRPDPTLAQQLVADLIERDPRLTLDGDTVELTPDGYEDLAIEAAEFVVFDVETTGTNVPGGRIIEIGAYKVREGKIVDEFVSLVNAQTPIPPFISSLTRITNAMVADAPLFADIADELLEFIGGSVLVAHNSGFDMSFLNHEIGRIYEGQRLANPCLCTVKLSRNLLPDIANHKLKTVAEFYEVDLRDHHRAGPDARATAHIFINLLTQLRDEGVTDLASVQKIASRRQRYARRNAA